ncbi:hypothetical protein ACR77J_07665 [Tissierella praeacuta]|uniref:hypothetical protein n=1 Tax=Tissierella praeacuta TaxID=43131 RepID=UPI003DA5905B
MGVGFNWFKNYKVNKFEDPRSWLGNSCIYSIEYLDGDSTSHSYGNRTKLQNLFELIDKSIPTVNDEIFYDDIEDYIKNTLIQPTEMSSICDKLLNSGFDLLDMKDRIKWIKELSDEGYYVSYDML